MKLRNRTRSLRRSMLPNWWALTPFRDNLLKGIWVWKYKRRPVYEHLFTSEEIPF